MIPPNCTMNTSDTPDPDFRQHLQEILRGYNQTASTVSGPNAQTLNIKLIDDQGTLMGGVVALIYWGWLVIDLLVLDDSLRGQGWGTQLVAKVEAEARARGCIRAHTSTYAFQALKFYQKLDYHIIGQLDDYPDGYTLYWLRKEL